MMVHAQCHHCDFAFTFDTALATFAAGVDAGAGGRLRVSACYIPRCPACDAPVRVSYQCSRPADSDRDRSDPKDRPAMPPDGTPA